MGVKQVLCFLLLNCLLATAVQAQILDSFTATATVNESIIFSDDRNTVRDPQFGWEIGVLAEKQIARNIELSTGLTFSRIRFGLRDVGDSQVTYLSLPLNVSALLPFNFYAKTGVKLDIKADSRDAMVPVVINGYSGYMGDGFASASDTYVPGWSIGAGKIFNFRNFRPWIEIKYTQDFNSFSGYDGIINMEKRTRKVSIGIPIWNDR
ncbi:hypothetical protein [Halalkalibaculum roseum]|nr:hypothetical protein [Halalkalibaculum roseum]